MSPRDHLAEWATANGLKRAAKRFAPYHLSETPPPGAGATNAAWPCANEATCFTDRRGRPTAIVVETFGGHDIRRLRDLVQWLRLEPWAPPVPRDEDGRMFLVITRPGFGEPKWPPLEATAA